MWQWFSNIFAAKPTPDVAEPVIIITCQGHIEASLCLSQLQDAGIPASAIGADSATIFGVQSGALAEIRIVVPADYADEARAVLEINDEPDDESDDESDDTNPFTTDQRT
jgi:hypothetical protein